jgi:hypothetical protein
LFLPDMVEAHIANLNLQPVETKHEDVFERRDFNKFETDQSAFGMRIRRRTVFTMSRSD